MKTKLRTKKQIERYFNKMYRLKREATHDNDIDKGIRMTLAWVLGGE